MSSMHAGPAVSLGGGQPLGQPPNQPSKTALPRAWHQPPPSSAGLGGAQRGYNALPVAEGGYALGYPQGPGLAMPPVGGVLGGGGGVGDGDIERKGGAEFKDIQHLVAFAHDRGIRVVPEFDVPGHARGMLPLEGEGAVEFCTDAPTRSQLFDDPARRTYGTVESLVDEMASLFPDAVFHVGCDETSVKGRCPLNTTFAFEQRLAEHVAEALGKTAEGWEEVLFSAGAATNRTIINAWHRHRPPEITKTGRRAVESWAEHFYFTRPAKGGPEGWAPCWYDISTGVPADERPLLLGGEMSMWSDTYCYEDQCGSSVGPVPVGAPLFPPSMDAEFAESVGGMVFPRGFVGAAAFWNFNATADPSSKGFEAAIWRLNDQLIARGAKSCPSRCSCDQLTACGKPYIEPSQRQSMG